MKTLARYLSKKRFLLKTIFKSKIKSTINQYKLCRFWLNQGLKRITRRKETSTNEKTRINDIFNELNEDRDSLISRLNSGQDLYPNCDTSIWLRSCTHEISNPIQGKIKGNYYT